MAKDPAVLIYFDKWISSTNGMKAEFRAWYFDLIIYQYDKGKVPTDIDELAGICRVRPSEYQVFNQMVEQVVKQKFDLVDGFYYNSVIGEVLRKREEFKDKREKSGNIGVIVKAAKSFEWCTSAMIDKLKEHLFSLEISEILKLKDNQVLKHLLKLYIDVDVDKDIIIAKGKESLKEKPLSEIPEFSEFLSYAKEKEPSVETSALKNKYDAWIENKWKDGNGSPIKNWKSKLLQTMPYIKKETRNEKTSFHTNRN